MRLVISRRKDKSLLRGSSLALDARVELSSVENALVESYKAHSVILHSETEGQIQNLTIGHLLKGVSYRCSTIDDVVKKEATVRVACRSLKAHLNVMENFDKETVEEF